MLTKTGSQNNLLRLLSLIAACTIATGVLAVFLFAAQSMPVRADQFGIGLITDSSSVNGSVWDWLSYQGLIRAETDLGVHGTVYTATSPADYYANLTQCVLDENQLCISVGFQTLEAISVTASLNPGVDFAIVDMMGFTPAQPNLRAINFRVDEPSYLAGTLAGLMTQSDMLGLIGGMEIPGVTVFIDGFTQGAKCSNPDLTQIVTYTNNFSDPDLGASVAQDMIQQGADVIFPPAGPTGFGAIFTATQSSVWAVGYDIDLYDSLLMTGTVPGSEYLLTSVVKKVDNAVYLTITDAYNGTFSPGSVTYGLAEGGVGLAPFHAADSSIPAAYKDRLSLLEQGIISGTVNIHSGCPAWIFLPLINH